MGREQTRVDERPGPTRDTHKALARVNETSWSTIDLLIGRAHLGPHDVLPGSHFVPFPTTG